MPVLQTTSSKLTYREYRKGLKENSDYPEVQEANKKFQAAIKSASLGIQTQFANIQPFLNFSNQVSQTLKQLTLPTTILADTLKTFNTSRYLLPKLTPSINISSVLPEFSTAMRMINLMDTETLKLAQVAKNSHQKLLDDISERMLNLTEPRISLIPPRSDTSILLEIRNSLEDIAENGRKENDVSNQAKGLIDTLYPEGNGKNDVPRRILDKLQKDIRVDVFHIAQCIYPGLTRDEFNQRKNKQKSILYEVENRIRVMRKKLARYELYITMKSGFCELVERKR